jgi:hypothetical protein
MSEETILETQPQSVVDRFVEKAISRKFLAWLTATGLLAFSSNLTSEDWVTVTAIYIGGQTVVDAVVKLRGRS